MGLENQFHLRNSGIRKPASIKIKHIGKKIHVLENIISSSSHVPVLSLALKKGLTFGELNLLSHGCPCVILPVFYSYYCNKYNYDFRRNLNEPAGINLK